jgi:hypothetical protein
MVDEWCAGVTIATAAAGGGEGLRRGCSQGVGMLRGGVHLDIRRRAPGARDVVADGGNESGEAGHVGDCSWRCQQTAMWERRMVARQRSSQTSRK